jgi:hypothetical protein
VGFGVPGHSQPGQAGTKRSNAKGISRKAAKDAKKSLYLGCETNEMAFLCELGAFARKFLLF